MSLRTTALSARLGLSRGSVAICISTRGNEALPACLDRVMAHTPADVPVLLVDDGSPDGTVAALLAGREFAGRDVHLLRREENAGFVANMNQLFAMTAPADVIILNDDCEVAEGWFEGLQAAVNSDSIIASATALTNHGSIVSVPERNEPMPDLPPGWTVDEAAAAVRKASRRVYPQLPALVGHCAYIKRSALELIGDFDLTFSPGYGEEVDFAQRCLLRGLCHVAADDVFVYHHGSRTFNARAEALKAEHELVIQERFPYYHDMVHAAAAARTGPLANALATARRALLGPSVTIDGSCLVGSVVSGTQVHLLELVKGLHRAGGVSLRLLVPRPMADYAREVLDELDGVEQIVWEDVDEDTERTDVVHRPFQVSNPGELQRLRELGDHLVITQQDFIAFRNPGYFASFADWEGYRQSARLAMKVADRVVFFSQHAACEARKEQLVDSDRSRVVYIGVDHHLTRTPIRPRRPATDLDLEGRGFILFLGVDFVHKNRHFALQVMERLQSEHGWDGCLVLAGPQASPGSSAEMDRAFLDEHPRVAASTVLLGAVPEAEKRWLLERASLVLSPTTYEGFGLVPFEAAEAGTPCLFGPQASLAEVLPRNLALIEPWDAGITAERAVRLIQEPAEAKRFVDAVNRAAGRFRWDETAQGLLRVYREAADAVGVEPDYALLKPAPPAVVVIEGRLLRSMSKAVGWWYEYGFIGGTWQGGHALVRKIARRLRLLPPSEPTKKRRPA